MQTPTPWHVNENTKHVAQGLVYEESTGKNVAVTYQGYDDALFILRIQMKRYKHGSVVEEGDGHHEQSHDGG